MITETRDRFFARFVPRQWKKKDSCRRRSCRKRRAHWHWVLTMTGQFKMMARIYTKPLIKMLTAPSLYELVRDDLPKGQPGVLRIGLPEVKWRP